MQALFDQDEQIQLSCKPELRDVFWYNIISLFWRYFIVFTFAIIYVALHDYDIQNHIEHQFLLKLTIVILLLLAVISVIYNLLYVKNAEYIITNKKIYLRFGIFNISKKILLYRSIADFDLQQNLLQRLFGLGTLNIDEYAGSSTSNYKIIGLKIEKLEAMLKIINENMQKAKNIIS